MKILNALKNWMTSDTPIADDYSTENYSFVDMTPLLKNLSVTEATKLGTRQQVLGYFYGITYAASAVLAESIMDVDFTVEELKKGSGEGVWERFPNHRIESLIKDPNPFTTGQELKYKIAQDLFFFGESFIKIETNGLNAPTELIPLYGNIYVFKVDAQTKAPTQYKQELDNQNAQYIDAKNIIHIRKPKLNSPYKAAGSVMAAAGIIENESELNKAEKEALKRGVYPSAILFIKGTPSAKQREAMEKELNDRYSGSKNFGKPIALPADKIDYRQISNNLKDMQIGEESKAICDRLLRVLRVPPELLGDISGVNRASLQALDTYWTKYRVQPLISILESAFNHHLVHPFYNEKFRLVGDNIVPENKEFELKRVSTLLKAGAITINEARAMQDIEPIEDGDRLPEPRSDNNSNNNNNESE